MTWVGDSCEWWKYVNVVVYYTHKQNNTFYLLDHDNSNNKTENLNIAGVVVGLDSIIILYIIIFKIFIVFYDVHQNATNKLRC